MIFSQMCQIAIKSVLYLASRIDSNETIKIKTIASQINENEHTISKTLQRLTKLGIINSSKGPNGGFNMTLQQIEIPISDIVQCIDGNQLYHDCILGLKTCNKKKPCPLHEEYKKSRTILTSILKGKSLKMFAQEISSESTFLLN